MKAKLLLSSLLLTAMLSPSFAQTTIGNQNVDQYPVSAAGDLTYGLTYLPADYNPAKKYPLIIFLHGSGEGGDGVSGLNNLVNQGLPWWIARGFKPAAVNPVDGQNYEFIVCSPQAPASWQWSYDYNEIQYMVPNILSRYSIDQSRMYVTGLSAGGSGTWSCMTHDPNFAMKFAAIMPNSDAGLNNTPLEMPFMHNITSVYGVPVWCVDGALDGLQGHTTVYLDTINTGPPIANPLGVQTLIAGAGHSAAAWDSAYSPTWRSNVFNQTAYEWMLRYKRSGVVNTVTAVTAFAGVNQTISLPTSTTSLSGTGNSGNPIASYSWAELSGPSNASIGNSSSASTAISALVAGTYTFQLTVKDNTGAAATSTVSVTVNPIAALSLIVPTVTAGTNQSITLPNNTINLLGTVLGNGADITSTTWVQTSGPSTATITSPWLTSTSVTGLVAGTYNFQLSVNVLGLLSATANITVTVNPPAVTSITSSAPSSGGATIPGIIQAENYSSMSGVQTEATSDAGGGLDVGWIDQGDWMNYNVNVTTAGTYTVGFRVATTVSGGVLQLKDASGNLLATVNVPNTGNWETFQTVTASVTLHAGNQTLQVYDQGYAGWNINYMDFEGGGSTTTAPSGTTIPGIIQAENYTTMSGVQTETTSDAGGGLDVGWIDQGDWMNYNVNVSAAGTYTVGFRVATTVSGGVLQLKDANGNVLATVNVPNTGNWETFQTVTASVTLPAGNQTLQVYDQGYAGWNINYMDFEGGGSTTTTTAPPGTIIPGVIQAENYTTMSGVQTETTSDAGGGLDVGWIDQGDWMDYNVNVSAAGTYSVGFRVATTLSGGILQLRDANGNALATVNVPNTGNWETFQTVTASVTLPAGNQTLQVYDEGDAGWNINYMDFEGGGTTTTAPAGTIIPGIIQAENFTTMSGVQTENSSDAGGGLDVGWIDQGDWMNYNVYVTAAGTYAVGFRVATTLSGGVLQLRDATGNVLTTVNVPNTGNWESFQTVTAFVTLPAGYQTLQVYDNAANAGWNFNWMDFETNASAIAQSASVITNGQASALSAVGSSLTPALNLFPNPAQDNFILSIDNNQMGKMIVQIINPSGQISKTYSLNKGTQSSTNTLDISDLPTGVYSIRIQIGDWSAIRQLVKIK